MLTKDNSERKSETINIRITSSQRRILEKNGLSPTDVFNRALKNNVLENRKNIAKNNLEKYPAISAMFHKAWVLEQIDSLMFDEERGVYGHGLAWLLSNYPDENVLSYIEENKRKAKSGDVDAGMMAYLQGRHIYEPLLKLGELEKNLEMLKTENKIIRTIEKAQNGDQFWHTLSEIEVAAYFKRKNIFKKLEPQVEGKTPDILVILEKEEFCVEIFTPSLAHKLKEAMKRGEAVFLGNRAFGKINDKIEQLPKNTPCILVINHAFSEIDPINIADAILGSQSLWLPKDTNAEPKICRNKDGIAHSRELSNIKAIVLYKRVFDLNIGLVTIPEVKRILITGGNNMTDRQEAILKDVFQSMVFSLEKIV